MASELPAYHPTSAKASDTLSLACLTKVARAAPSLRLDSGASDTGNASTTIIRHAFACPYSLVVRSRPASTSRLTLTSNISHSGYLSRIRKSRRFLSRLVVK